MKRLSEPRRFLQILLGPRQVGKTTLLLQVLEELDLPSHYASADEPTLEDRAWIEQQWDLGRLRTRGEGEEPVPALLILDEIQKVESWSDVVKGLWDEDSRAGVPLRVVLLGSSPLYLQRGLSESLAGRFEVVSVPHWSFSEMRAAFGWDVETFVHFGGYPGPAPLVEDEERWRRYVLQSLVETSVSRDILLLTRIHKPALLRRLFQLACEYAGQVLSYQKMVGQLQDAGNTTTLAHYLDLLDGAGLVAGLQKDSGSAVRRRSSSPKLQPYNNALVSSMWAMGFQEVRRTPDRWGRLVESAVGAHLLNLVLGTDARLTYWRERNQEVDFVLRRGGAVTALEVKSTARKTRLPGMAAFARKTEVTRKLLVGGQGMPLEELLTSGLDDLL